MKELIDSLKKKFKEKLICVGLHNIGFMIEERKNGLLVVIDKMKSDDLHRIKKIYIKYGKKTSNPIIVDEKFFQNISDVFCIEILQMQENLNILYGKNPLKNIKINRENLRRQCKYELQGKLLTLKSSFLNMYWERKMLHDLLLRSAYNFSLIIKNLLYLKEKEVKDKTKQELFDLFEETYDKSLSVIKEIVQLRKTPLSELISLFVKYVNEMEAIVEIV
ncbi:MAG: hypothetical protein J7J73_01870 [Deltaproteobacteria bacterium]|nr:hypothetical protein [Deltaproteobacteria bacterium]